MPTLKLTKTVIDDLKPGATDQVYWDQTLRGFGLKVMPTGRKVFIVMYRTTDSRRLLRMYTLGTYGVLTLFTAQAAAQKILLARLDGQDPAAAKQASRKRPAGLRLEDVIAQYPGGRHEVEELDLEKGIWTLPAKRTRSRRSHVVHLAPEMLALLPEREDDHPLVFRSPRGVTTWSVHDPANAAGAKDLLGDRSERVITKHYNLASRVDASRRMTRVITNLKR